MAKADEYHSVGGGDGRIGGRSGAVLRPLFDKLRALHLQPTVSRMV